MRHLKQSLLLIGVLVVGGLLLGLGASAVADEAASQYHHVGTVTEPASLAIIAGTTFSSLDIGFTDSKRHVFYLADRSNNAVDAVDTTDGSWIGFVGKGQFTGVVPAPPAGHSGPNGVAVDKDGNVWAGDGNSTLKGFDPRSSSPAPFANINTGGTARADELAFGEDHGGRILIGNPSETGLTGHSAFVSLINTDTQSIIGKVVYDAVAGSGLPAAGHGFDTYFGSPPRQHGLEQPVFLDGRFYLNVPGTVQNPGGEIDVFDANATNPAIIAILPLTSCGGTGLAAGPDHELIAQCGPNTLLLKTDGTLVDSFSVGGSDEIWFNKGDGNVYLSVNSPVSELGIIDIVHRKVVGVVPLIGARSLRGLAADAENKRILVGVSDSPDNGAGGIAMFKAHHGEEGGD